MINDNAESPILEQNMTEYVHAAFRLFMAVRYWKYLVLSVMAAAFLLGILYYVTAERLYYTKATLLISQAGHDQLNTSIANDNAVVRSDTYMFTYENIIHSEKVFEDAGKKLKTSSSADFSDASVEALVGDLKSKIATKIVKNTNIIDIGYTSNDPSKTAEVVRAVVKSYLDFMDIAHKGTAGEISKVLTRERNDIADKLAKKQNEMLEARRNLSDIGFRSDSRTLHPLVQRAVFFNDALIAAQKESAECEAALASVQSVLANGSDVTQCINMVSGILGKEIVMENLGLGSQNALTRNSLEHELVMARSELLSLQQNFGFQHPEVVAQNEKIRTIEQFLDSSRLGNAGSQTDYLNKRFGPWLTQMLQNKMSEARKQEEIFKERFNAASVEAINLNGQLVQIELLERDIKRLADMSDVLLNQIASLDLKQNGQDIRVAVIEEPKVPTSPVSPNSKFVLALTAFLGICASLLLVVVFDALNDRFRTLEELQNRLKITLLAVIWRLKPMAEKGLQAIAIHATPHAPECEGFRTLRTALGMTNQDARQILISSVESGDGKTTTLANLAVCYAQADKRILLIDADLHRMGLTQLFEMRGTLGLSEVLRRSEDIEMMAAAHIRPSGIKGLDILPAGPKPSNPSELLACPRFTQLLSWAGSIYDYIFIDSTPALITTDPTIIAQVVDGVVFVVQPAKNRRQMISHMVERYRLLKIPVLGLIVNAAGSEEDAYYGHHGRYGGYGNYGSYGNYGDENNEVEFENGEYDLAVEPQSVLHAWNGNEEEDTPPLITPRRVA
jgi:capsular exopolysaccharide synthesis family protein